MQQQSEEKAGLIYALIAYGIWGLFPLYFYLLKFASPPAVLCHRIVWSVFFLIIFLAFQSRWDEVIKGIRNPKTFWLLVLTSLLISSNWLIFTWAAANGHVIEGSLGYLICPILNVMLGVVFLKETLTTKQKFAIGIVCTGVLIAIIAYGRLPWVAISLAITFALYGFFRKKVEIKSQPGLMIETLVVFVPALVYLLCVDSGNFLNLDLYQMGLLFFVGLLTVLPLVSIGVAYKSLPMKTVGMMQYISPVSHFTIGLFVLGEAFSPTQAISFTVICIGLIVFAITPRKSRSAN